MIDSPDAVCCSPLTASDNGGRVGEPERLRGLVDCDVRVPLRVDPDEEIERDDFICCVVVLHLLFVFFWQIEETRGTIVDRGGLVR